MASQALLEKGATYNYDNESYEDHFDDAEDKEGDKDEHKAIALITAPIRSIREVESKPVNLPCDLGQFSAACNDELYHSLAVTVLKPVHTVIHTLS